GGAVGVAREHRGGSGRAGGHGAGDPGGGHRPGVGGRGGAPGRGLRPVPVVAGSGLGGRGGATRIAETGTRGPGMRGRPGRVAAAWHDGGDTPGRTRAGQTRSSTWRTGRAPPHCIWSWGRTSSS